MSASWIFACFAVALVVGALLFILPALAEGKADDRAALAGRMRRLATGMWALGIPLVALAAYLSVGRPDALETDRQRASFIAEHAQRMTAGRIETDARPDAILQTTSAIAATGAGTNAAENTPASTPDPGAQDTARVAGQVTVAPELVPRIAPDATLFVFARSPAGPPMPVAVFRAPVSTWPMRFVLDADARVMTGQSIADFEQVTLTARISRSGQALPQPGDLEGRVEAVRVGSEDLRIVIDSVR